MEAPGHVVNTESRGLVVEVQLQLVPGEPVGADLLIDLTQTFVY